MEPIAVNDVISAVLSDMNNEISEQLKGDCVFIHADMNPPLDNVFREIIEGLKEEKKSNHLVVLLETAGGYVEIVERIVFVMRKHYKRVSFVVPSHAYSAGTVLVLSGDEIYMDYYSVLGPIDPQYYDSDSKTGLPGAGYLAKFKELTDTVNQTGLANSKAELAYLIRRFDPAKLFLIEQSIMHGRSLISEWLPKYKFKNWKETETKEVTVSASMRKNRAKEIAEILGDAERWHSHGRGITMQELCSNKIKLKIIDFGRNKNLSHAIRNYRGMCVDFAQKMGTIHFIHTSKSMRQVF